MLRLRLLLRIIFTLCIAVGANFNSSSAQSAAADYVRATPAANNASSAIPKFNTSDSAQLPHAQCRRKNVEEFSIVNDMSNRSIIGPTAANVTGSMIVYPYREGTKYIIPAASSGIVDIQFKAGEQVISIAGTDKASWQLSKTVSGSGAGRIEHVLVRPSASGLNSNVVVTTNQRTYYFRLKSTLNTPIATVKWTYAEDAIPDTASFNQDDGLSVNAENLRFPYKIELKKGRKDPDWLPQAVFHDGVKTYIEFQPHVELAPTLFVRKDGGNGGEEAVTYHVISNYYVIDNVVDALDLTSGDVGRDQIVVEVRQKAG
jgi:P-type conjugative transfer protein TrbG